MSSCGSKVLLPLACLRQACACLERRFSLDVTGSMSFGKTRPLSSMCHNSTLSVYGMSEHWALTFPKPTRQFKDIPSYNLALICSSNKSFRISCKGLSETPLHFIFRYKEDSVGRYRRYRFICFKSREERIHSHCELNYSDLGRKPK